MTMETNDLIKTGGDATLPSTGDPTTDMLVRKGVEVASKAGESLGNWLSDAIDVMVDAILGKQS